MKPINTILKTLAVSLALAGAPQLVAPARAAESATAAETVDINSADAATLDRVLLNVGPSKAQAIVDYRSENGPFRSAEELALVTGIGLRTIENNRDRIRVGAPAQPRRAAAPAAPASAPAAKR